MKKNFLLLILPLLFTCSVFPQQDQFNSLNGSQVVKFAQPFVTSLGEGLNTGGFYTAQVPQLFGVGVTLRYMYIMVPNSQLTYTPSLPNGYNSSPTATFWGKEGGIYSGPNGYITYPNGINQTNIPFIIPQISASLLGTELMIRYLPGLTVAKRKLNFFGVGVRHSISQYFPLIPVDLAVQVLYNKLTVNGLINATSFAVNGEVSKSFDPLTIYGGLQYETSNFDLSYTLQGDPNSGDPSLRQSRNISASVKGQDNFRLILGASLNLAVIALNIDYNISSQPVICGGISFEL